MNELISSEQSTAKDLAEIIQHDPALTAQILKVVNSAYYNLPRKVDTVSRAIAVIGTNDLYNLATALSAAKVFSDIPCHMTSPDEFWRHAIATGVLAKKIAKSCNVLGTERLYVAGLLHDIGSLLLYSQQAELASEVLMIANGDEEVLYQAEMDLIGYNHAQVGAALMQEWRMPETLLTAIKYHHNPAEAPDINLDAAILYLANYLSNCHPKSAFMQNPAANPSSLDSRVWNMVNLSEEVIDELMEEFEEDFAAALAVMMPGKQNASKRLD
jgi:putative nucleotidyltransferase with HDIG domain